MISKLAAAAAGDWGFGTTSERWAGGQRTVTAICVRTLRHATTVMRLAFLLFFPSSSCFLRFPSDLQNCCMEFVFVFFLFIEIFVSVVGISKWFTSVHILSGESLFWRMPVCFFGSVVWFTGVLFCFQ